MKFYKNHLLAENTYLTNHIRVNKTQDYGIKTCIQVPNHLVLSWFWKHSYEQFTTSNILLSKRKWQTEKARQLTIQTFMIWLTLVPEEYFVKLHNTRKSDLSCRSLLNCIPCVPACWCGLCANLLACQHGLHTNVLAGLCGLRANLPKACQLLIFTCQRTKRCVNVSTCCTNVPKSMPIFQTFLLQNTKGNFYSLLLYNKFYIILDIILVNIVRICIVHKNCVALYYYTLWNFFVLYIEMDIQKDLVSMGYK